MRLCPVSEAEFDAAFDLIEESFPACERRERAAARALLQDPLYTLYHIEQDGKRVGIFGIWLLRDFTFVEHFAILPAMRNAGLGAKALALLAKEHRLIVLEAEPPESEMAVRRLGFYARAGLLPNDLAYLQPAYRQGEAPVPLLLLSRPAPLSDPATVAAEIHRVVYKVS